MKILYHHRTRSRDGQSVHIGELTGALRRLGHEVVMVAPPATEQAPFGADAGGVAILKRMLPPAFYELLELTYNIVAFARLRRAYLQHRPDVLYERYSLYMLAGTWLSRRYRLPMLLEVNSPLAAERSRFNGLALGRLAANLERATWRAADRVLPVSHVLAGLLQTAGVEPGRITVIPNAVPEAMLTATPDGAAIRRQLGLEAKTVLGFTGFVREWHGLDAVIDLIAESDPALQLHLLLVGDGPARPGLERQAQALGVADRVSFAGLVGRERVNDYIAAFDIALQPHVVGYASPLKLFEYMMIGRAIVAPDTPNVRELLTHGETAWLFDPDERYGLRDAVLRLCGDLELRRRLGAAARAEISTRSFTWEENARRVGRLCEQLVTHKGKDMPTDRP